MKIILAVAVISAATSGMVGVIGAGEASAQPLTRTFAYTCSAQMIGNQPMTVKITSDIPKSVAVGAPSRTIAVKAVAKVDASFTQWLAKAGMKSIGGTADARAHVAAPQNDFDLTVPFRLSTTNAPASGPFSINATAGATAPTFRHPGKGTVTAGDLMLHLAARNGNLWLTADAPCTLNTGQSNVVTSFDVTKPGSGASATPHPSTGSGTSVTPRPTTGSAGAPVPGPTTGSVGAAAPRPTTGSVGAAPATHGVSTPGEPSPGMPGVPTMAAPTHAAPGSAEPPPAGKTSAGGQDTRDLILLAVGVLAACAAAFGLGARRRNNGRPSSDGGEEQRPPVPQRGLLIEGVKDGSAHVGHHRRGLAAAVPPRRGHGGRAASHGSADRWVAEGQNLLMGRHVPHQAGHQGVGARACGGADVNSQLPGLLEGEDIGAVTDEQSGTAYVRQS
ncbi:DUF6801 domain-containing protein [Streptomyces sp. BBFR2]|uniref:DUF6801 domain-containing protein n=1 Tax=Streptomyces sp. BBFR2 TaxID=3372854 RepID=UPI0037DA1FAD